MMYVRVVWGLSKMETNVLAKNWQVGQCMVPQLDTKTRNKRKARGERIERTGNIVHKKEG